MFLLGAMRAFCDRRSQLDGFSFWRSHYLDTAAPHTPKWKLSATAGAQELRTTPRGKLTYAPDRIPALAAVTKPFRDSTGDVPLVGLWKNDLCIGLLWAVDLGFDKPQPLRFGNVSSWSRLFID